MESNQVEHTPALGDTHLLERCPDPQLVEAVRTALAKLAPEPPLLDAPAAEASTAETKGDAKQFGAIRSQLWQLASAVLVSAAGFAGVFVYMQLTKDLGASRKEVGRVRRELGLVRNEVVRKDEFNSRNLSAQALIREAQVSGKNAADAALQRLQEQKQALAELRPLLNDLQREAERLRLRLAAPEKTPAAPAPHRPTTNERRSP